MITKKLSNSQWNAEVVKELTFEQFSEKAIHFEKVGTLEKSSDSEKRKVYESITGKKVETNKNKKDE